MSDFPLIKEIIQRQQDWTPAKFKIAADVQLGKMLQPKQVRLDDTYEKYLRAANISWSGVKLSDVQEMWISPFEKIKYNLKAGDVLVSEGGDVGRSSYLSEDLPHIYFQNAINRVRPSKENDGRFLYYWMYVVKQSGWLEILCNRATIAHFTAEKLRETEVILPPLAIQRKISEYLDRETARIDTLISEKESLLQLLEEKRASIISHTVTRGLNPEVKLKPSGIPWLGDVPEHWEVVKLRHLISHITSGSRGWSRFYASSGDKFIRIGNLRRGSLKMDLNDIQHVQIPTDGSGESAERAKLKQDDVLFSITAYLGSVGICPPELEGAYVSQHVALVRLRNAKIFPTWLGYYALGNCGQIQLNEASYGGTKMQLSLDDIREFTLPIPPLQEQQAIISLLQQTTATMDTLRFDIQTSIHLLREKKTSMISAAVTGEINLTNLNV
jgi:type I restriction enzyme S subunit